tara:strand:+ start:4132 stop:4392 length:261 start_codon:yes stop_codon:yes gene_type:complete
MLNNILKFFITIFILLFFLIVFNYYFSDKNKDLVINNRSNIDKNMFKNVSELPVLYNDTNNVIEFNSGFDDSNNRNFKRNFWDLFK